jgi:hypothetical protein
VASPGVNATTAKRSPAARPSSSVATMVAQVTPAASGWPTTVAPDAERPLAAPSKVTRYRSGAPPEPVNAVPPMVAS